MGWGRGIPGLAAPVEKASSNNQSHGSLTRTTGLQQLQAASLDFAVSGHTCVSCETARNDAEFVLNA